jgi:hypothetical protein
MIKSLNVLFESICHSNKRCALKVRKLHDGGEILLWIHDFLSVSLLAVD